MPSKKYINKQSVQRYKKTVSENISTAKFLLIVESPSKCNKIENYLGPHYCCIASAGHIRTIKDGLKSIDKKNNFEPTFSIIDEKEKHVESMRKIIKQFSPSNVFLATDDDREGEAIAWHICKVFDLPIDSTPRIIFHEITKPAIVSALESPIKINMDLVHAQHARQVLDIIVGFKVSPFLWKYVFSNKANSLSAGRCQTPALRLIYENQKDQDTGNGIEKKYKTTGIFTANSLKFDLNHEFETEEQVLTFLKSSVTHKHMMTIKSPKEAKMSPPKPFHTSRLLQVSSNILHISPSETMNLCQQLYQNGYITYMRTESSQYSQVFLENMKKYIIKQYSSPDYIGKMDLLENKDISKPHEAIRVTDIEKTEIESDNSRLCSMYKLIWKNSIESCMSEAKYQNTTICIDSPADHVYTHIVELPLFLGWKKVTEKKINEISQNTPSSLILYLNTLLNQKIYNKEIESIVVVRNKHQHYTEASLIQKLEELGIGRPSTFASIVETIQERKYVKVDDIDGEKTNCLEYKLSDGEIKTIEKEKVFGNEKKKLVIQAVGVITIEFLLQHFHELFTYEYTEKMESRLDMISSGKELSWSTLCKDCYEEIKRLSNSISSLAKQSYPIDENHSLVFEKFGAVIKRKTDIDKYEYIPVKKTMNIDLEKVKRNEYTLDELVEKKYDSLGKYEGEDLYIKNGKFGPYMEWGDKRESLKTLLDSLHKKMEELTLEDIEEFFKDPHFKIDKNVLRILNSSMSVRKGKFGPYVYYQRRDMKSPTFLNIKGFAEEFAVCKIETLVNWICEKYKVSPG